MRTGGSVLPDHVFELELAGAGGGFFGARALEGGDFFGAGDGGGPAAGFFQEGKGTEAAELEVMPLRWRVGGFEDRIIGDECLAFAFAGGVFGVGKLLQRPAAKILEAVEDGGVVFRVAKEFVIDGERFGE